MAEKRTTVNISAGSFLGLLTLVFLVLKLTGVIAWSWWWVFAPVWIPAGLALAFFAIAAVAVFVAYLRDR